MKMKAKRRTEFTQKFGNDYVDMIANKGDVIEIELDDFEELTEEEEIEEIGENLEFAPTTGDWKAMAQKLNQLVRAFNSLTKEK